MNIRVLIILIPGQTREVEIEDKNNNLTCKLCGGTFNLNFKEEHGDTTITAKYGDQFLVGTYWIIRVSSTDKRTFRFLEDGVLIWIEKRTIKCSWKIIQEYLVIIINSIEYRFDKTGKCISKGDLFIKKIIFQRYETTHINVVIGTHTIINTIWILDIKLIGKGKIEFVDDRTIKWDGKIVD